MFVPLGRPFYLAVAVALALVFASGRAAGGSPAADRYVVKPGDTLWEIAAERYDGDPRAAVWRVQERNGLTSSALTPGMILSLPP
jgi:nucleoid-associated protein YgaU